MILKTKILVIEDDQRMAKTIRNVLSIHGYNVCCVDNGASGIEKAFEYNPDLILCDIKMAPINGYQVYNVLKDSSVIDHIPFIFITGCNEIQDIRIGMDLGADDYFIKPFDNEKLLKTIEKRLTKYRKLRESGREELKALYSLTPNGILLFDGNLISEANSALIQILGIPKSSLISSPIENLFDPVSYHKIKDKIVRCSHGLLNSFCETVTLITSIGEKIEVALYVKVYDKSSVSSLMVGLIILDNKNGNEKEVLISDILYVLKQENIFLTESLGEKLINVFKQQNINLDFQKKDFFTKRETQVLCLSMEGLPIKLIADRLSISDRTVENHRAKLMEKTHSKNIIEVIAFVIRNHLINIFLATLMYG
jgi:DNA-binding NarL/FixJ family response regulator